MKEGFLPPIDIEIFHYLISTLGVSHPALEQIINITAKQKIHTKLTGAGGGGFVLILLLSVFAVLRCNKKKEDRSGNRESIDLNQQYGADEYYEYMKHDTNVVDDNDMYNYNDCDYED